MKLNFKNFCDFLVFYPLKADNKKDKAVALVATVVFGILSLGLVHAVCAIKRCVTAKPTRGDKRIQKMARPLLKPQSSLPPIPIARYQGSQDELFEVINKEIDRTQPLDKKLGTPKKGSWRAYGETHGEVNQVLGEYDGFVPRPPIDYSLEILPLGKFSPAHKKIVSITADFLKVVHNIPNEVNAKVGSLQGLKDQFFQSELGSPTKKYYQNEIHKNYPRVRDKSIQYRSDLILDFIGHGEKRGEMKIVLTTEDLFSPSMSNFVFGSASPDRGVWSLARFGDPEKNEKSFEKVLLRTMKISAHEMGHMLGIPHCTDYECNMGGYMNMEELDDRSLLFCAQDSAKISFATHTSMKAYYENLLRYFETFNERYGLHLDFSYEIEGVKKRIGALLKPK